MWTSILFFCVLYCTANAVTYNTYRGEPATDEEIADYQEKKIADICTISFDDCDESELRRADASCNNLNHPSSGMYHTPQWRMLPAEFGENYEPRITTDGKEFPLARYIREHLLTVGDKISTELSALLPLFIEFFVGDVVSVHDIRNFRITTPNCCQPEGKKEYMCAPNYIPENDYVHRFSDITCHNNTRPITFQTTGCVSNETVPNRINYVTTHCDLSQTYLFLDVPLSTIRTYEGGRLKEEVVDGYGYPSSANESTTCTLEAAHKTGCSRNVPNGLLGSNLFTIWFWRHHNKIADGLAELNPCWDDEKLFRVAMDINIAYYSHILYYECLALLLGKENLIRDGVILPTPGYRDVYDEYTLPSLAIEFLYALRWFHITQRGEQKLYDEYDNYVRTDATVNFSARVFDLPFDDTMTQVTHGVYMEYSGGFDDTVDPDISDKGLGDLQRSFDIPTADIAKARYYGLPSYIKYRDMCSNYTTKHETYEDIADFINEDKILLHKLIYGDVKNVEIMSGLYTENLMKGSWVTPTLYCLLVPQLRRMVTTDRFWFEYPGRPNPLTQDQMDQISSGSLAALLCSVGNKVTEIQPQAFLTIGPRNCKVSCDDIPALDLTPWKDEQCESPC